MAAPSALLSHLKCGVAPAGLAVLIYLNSLSGELVHDDVFAIKENEDVRPRSPFSNLLKNDFWGEPMTSPTSHKSYRPLTVLTFRLNYLWHGLEPLGYHVVNVMLHILTTMLLGWFCRQEVFGGGRRTGKNGAGGWSLVVMLIFAAHPVHTEAVGSPVVSRCVCISLFDCLFGGARKFSRCLLSCKKIFCHNQSW